MAMREESEKAMRGRGREREIISLLLLLLLSSLYFCALQHVCITELVMIICSMGGLVVKQMLYQAKAESNDDLVNNTVGVVCFSFNDEQYYSKFFLSF